VLNVLERSLSILTILTVLNQTFKTSEEADSKDFGAFEQKSKQTVLLEHVNLWWNKETPII